MNIQEQVRKLWLNNLRYQTKKLSPLLIFVYVPSIVFLGSFVLINRLTSLNLSYLTRDPISVANGMLQYNKLPIYTGFISHLGILLWCTTAAICFFTYLLLCKTLKRSRSASFFFWSTGISLILLLDDLFLFHERIIPYYFGISETIVFVSYSLLIAIYFGYWWQKIIRTDYLFLLLALIFFSLSILLDIYGGGFFEEAFKFLGIVSWSVYYVRTCLMDITLLTYQ